MQMLWNTSRDACDVILSDMDDWTDFVAANRDEIMAYGTVEKALNHAMDGGLIIGGGAAPLFFISFDG